MIGLTRAVMVALFAWSLTTGFSAVNASDVDCPPVDEGTRHPDLMAFRADLQRAIARRDAAAP